jgi:formylmethanofuran dehydrogenase subunit B
MIEPNEPLPVCTFCSLLCDLTPSPSVDQNDRDFGATFCSRREREWALYREHSNSPMAGSLLPALDSEAIRMVRHRLLQAERVLVTGRIRSLESARSAIAVAERYRAILDVWESEPLFQMVQAIQRNGMHSVSLAEAREVSTLFIVIGDEGWLEEVPRLPVAMSPVGADLEAGVPMLLMGKWSAPAIAAWKGAGFDVIAIECDLQKVPGALAQASRQATRWGWESRVGEWLQGSRYTTVVWSPRHLKESAEGVSHGDLWAESMLQWIAQRNESQRAGALVWSSLEATFQQVCTWSTGFPGRVRFRELGIEYRPQEYSATRWLEESLSDPRALENSMVIWIDDSGEALPDSWVDGHVPAVVVSPRPPVSSQGSIVWLPASWSGIDHEDAYFRGDQTVLVRGQQSVQGGGLQRDSVQTEKAIQAKRPRAHEWLRRLADR